MRNLKIMLAYEGTAYCGWQVQPNGVSVQAVVENAIEQLVLQKANVLAAGRTDAGVHALGQVISFQTECEIDCEQFRRGLQNFFPEDIVVREVEDAHAEFHATYSAVSKRYRYTILNDRIGDPFVRRFAWHFWGDLDAAAMREAAQELLGEHDFRCFESHWPNKATSVRTIHDVQVFRTTDFPGWTENVVPSTTGRFLCLEIEADGFLYNMVRAITGTLLRIGRGLGPASEIRSLIESRDRAKAGETAPAHGLCLLRANY